VDSRTYREIHDGQSEEYMKAMKDLIEVSLAIVVFCIALGVGLSLCFLILKVTIGVPLP